MISFHGDASVPPELCTLLYHLVPEDLHAPVIFQNRKSAYAEATGDYAPGVCRAHAWIEVNLNPLFKWALDWSYDYASLAACTWRILLEVCLHEFGHIANAFDEDSLPSFAYACDDRAYAYCEYRADMWARRKLLELRDRDPRLAQPRLLSGYLGARIAHMLQQQRAYRMTSEGVGWYFVREVRCFRTGGQFTAGDLLRQLGLGRPFPPRLYRILREVSEDVGAVYVDRAGRRHRLYEWGDVPIIANRLRARFVPVRCPDSLAPIRLLTPFPRWLDGTPSWTSCELCALL